MLSKKHLYLVVLILFTVSGCKSGFSTRKPSPDEYTVVTYPPLDVPPNLSKLPEPGKSKILNSGNDISIKGSSDTNDALSKDTQTFLNQVTEGNNEGDIRETVDNEYISLQNEEKERGVIGKIIDRKKYKDDPVIDPVEEKKRIESNLKENEPINKGEVVEKSNKGKGLLNDLIN